jgi:hypothetical protein
MLTLRLKPTLEERLEFLAARTGRTKTFYASKAIEKCLPDFERDFPSIVEMPARDPKKIRQAIETLKLLRKNVTKSDGMTVKEMKEQGRA